MQSITRADAKILGAEIEEALAPVALRHGLELSVRGGTFAGTSFKPRIELKTQGADEKDFEQYARYYDLAGTFGKEFDFNGQRFRISGIAPRSPKRPILAQDVETGKSFKFTPDAVQNALRVTV